MKNNINLCAILLVLTGCSPTYHYDFTQDLATIVSIEVRERLCDIHTCYDEVLQTITGEEEIERVTSELSQVIFHRYYFGDPAQIDDGYYVALFFQDGRYQYVSATASESYNSEGTILSHQGGYCDTLDFDELIAMMREDASS